MSRFLLSTLFILAAVLTSTTNTAVAAPAFEDVTESAGMINAGSSWGGGWRDFNADGLPDLWAVNHARHPSLYINDGAGNFEDIATTLGAINPDLDSHGAVWGDYNNDGYPDLFQGNDGGSRLHSNNLYTNQKGLSFTDDAAAQGVDVPESAPRMPLWFDFDFDGRLDLLLTSQAGASGLGGTVLFQQTNNGFTEVTLDAGLTNDWFLPFALLADFTSDGKVELAMPRSNGFPTSIFQTDTLPFIDIQSGTGLTKIPSVRAAAIGDINGDLQPDFWAVRGHPNAGYKFYAPSNFEVSLMASADNDELGLDILSTGDLSLFVYNLGSIPIRTGASGILLSGRNINLSVQDSINHGIAPHDPAVDKGLYLGYNTGTETWMIRSSNVGRFKTMNIGGSTSTPIQQIIPIGFSETSLPSSDVIMLSTPTGYQDATVTLGISAPSWGIAVALADLDNDMDLDAYIAATGPVENRPNLLFENVNGQMLPVVGAGGAEGTLDGRADAVALADYDGDGFIDIATVNGRSKAPFDLDGPIQLFHNTGNENNWLEIDLEGVKSNRDGLGAIVVAQTGGVTQTRTQDSGILFKGQNDSRLHFGLADNTRVDSLQITWPSGTVQTIERIPANHIMRVIEESRPSVHGTPVYVPGVDSGIFIWKDHFDGPYNLFVSGDENISDWEISVLSSEPFKSVSPVQLDGDDQLTWTQNLLILKATVSSSDNGIQFTMAEGASTILSVKKNGETNPRLVSIGGTGEPVTPAGWILPAAGLPPIEDYLPLTRLGVVIGKSADGRSMEARWSGDKANPFNHYVSMKLISSEPFTNVTPISFESCCDRLNASAYSLDIDATVSSSWDALTTDISGSAMLALLYKQDSVFQSHRYLSNPTTDRFGNAFELPTPDLLGTVNFDPAVERGFFVSSDRKNWLQVRASAGGIKAVYEGSLISDQPPILIQSYRLEGNDILQQNGSFQVDFKMSIWDHYLDGLDIKYPPGTRVELHLNSDSGTPENDVFLGANKWPVLAVPVAFNL